MRQSALGHSSRGSLSGVEPAILAVTSLVGALVLALWRHMDDRFKQVDERFKQVDERFNQVDERFNRLEDKVGGQGERIARVEGVQSVVIASAPGRTPVASPTGAVPSEA